PHRPRGGEHPVDAHRDGEVVRLRRRHGHVRPACAARRPVAAVPGGSEGRPVVGPRMTAHVDDALWDEFHTLVNMTSRELQDWLATDAAHEDSEPAVGPVGTPTGRA